MKIAIIVKNNEQVSIADFSLGGEEVKVTGQGDMEDIMLAILAIGKLATDYTLDTAVVRSKDGEEHRYKF